MPEAVSEWLDIIGASMTLAGGVLAVIGSLGVLRFPDLYTRLHAASITDTGAATLMLFGLALMAGISQETVKLIIAWAFVMLTSPTASHALANAAWSSGHKPVFGAFNIFSGHEKPANEPAKSSDLGAFNLKAPTSGTKAGSEEGEPT